MSKLSFRARALDASKPMPIYMAEELPDLPDYSAISRAVAPMPSGMQKDEECEHHLQRAICTGLIIPTPEVTHLTDVETYEKIYPADYKLPRQLIHMQPFAMEQDIPDYDMDSEDEKWVGIQSRKMDLTPLQFEEMMDRLEKSSGQTVVTLNEAKMLLKEDDDLIIAVFDYWLNKRLKTRHKQKGYSAVYTSGGDLTEDSASNGENDDEYIDNIAEMAPPVLPAFPMGTVSLSNANAAASRASTTKSGKEKDAKRKSLDDSENLRNEFSAAKRLRLSSSSSGSSDNVSRDEGGSRVDARVDDSPDIGMDSLAAGGSNLQPFDVNFSLDEMPIVPRASTSSDGLVDPPISQSTPLSGTTSTSLRQTTWNMASSGVAAPAGPQTSQVSPLEQANGVKQLSQALKILAKADPEEMTDNAKLTWLMARQVETDCTISSMRIEQEQLSRRVSTNCCSGRRGGLATGAEQDDFDRKLPFSDIDELMKFNKSLETSKTARVQYRTFLSARMDSKDYKSSVNNVLVDVITNKLDSTKRTAKGRKAKQRDPAKQKFDVLKMHLWAVARQFIMAKHAIQARDLLDSQLDTWMRARAEAVRRGK